MSEAYSVGHLMTHLPKNPHCAACQRAKMIVKHARRKRRRAEDSEGPQAFGECVTADHLVSKHEVDYGIDQERFGMVVLDHYSGWVWMFPTGDKTAKTAESCLKRFRGDSEIKLMYTDNAPELVKAVDTLGIRHETSTPYRSPTNSKAERTIRKVLEGTRTVLEQSGFSSKWWPKASEHFCVSLNVEVEHGDSNFNRRYGRGNFDGPRIPFGALVGFRPPKPVLLKMPKFRSTSVPGFFMGYHIPTNGKWAGDCYVSPLSDFTESNVSGKVRMFRVKEVFFDKSKDFEFPMRAVRDNAERRLVPIQTIKYDVGEEGNPEEPLIDRDPETIEVVEINKTLEDQLNDGDIEDFYVDHDDGGKIKKRRRGSSRPHCIPTKVWDKMNANERRDAAELDAELKAKEKARIERIKAGLPEPDEVAGKADPAEPKVFGAAYRKYKKV